MAQQGSNDEDILKDLLLEEDDSGGVFDFSLVRIKRTLKKHFWWPILFVSLGYAGASIYLRYTENLYLSGTILKFNIETDANILGMSNELMKSKDPLRGEIEIIRSPLTISQVAKELGNKMKVEYFQEGDIMDSRQYPNSIYSISIDTIPHRLSNKKIFFSPLSPSKVQLGTQSREAMKTYPVGQTFEFQGVPMRIDYTQPFKKEWKGFSYYFILHTHQQVQSTIIRHLSVRVANPNANTISVQYEDPIPQRARDILKILNSNYIEQTIEEKNQSYKKTIRFIDDQLDSTSRKLQLSELRLEQFVRQNQAYEVKPQLQRTLEELQKINNSILLLESKLKSLKEIERKITNKQLDTAEYLFISSSELGSGLISSLKEYNKLLSEFERISGSVGENTYLYSTYESNIEKIKHSVYQQIDFLKENFEKELLNLKENRRLLEDKVLTIPQSATQLKRIQRIYSLNESFYMMMVKKRAELGITKAGTLPDCKVLNPPSVPSRPIFPDRDNIITFSSVGGGLFGIMLIVLILFTNNKILDPKTVEKKIGNLLGVIPLDIRKSTFAKIVIDDNMQSSFTESFRSIRTNLNYLLKHEKHKIITITSTTSGEGKTFIGLNLARLISLSNSKIILVDLDLRRPKINLALETENTKGVSTYLSKRDTLDEVIHNYDDSLDYITSGPLPANPSEMLLAKEFEELVAILQERYDYVLMDCPPVGLVTDGVTAIQSSDVCLYIFRDNYSKTPFIENYKRLKDTITNLNIAAIYNGGKANSSYGYGYGYYTSDVNKYVEQPYFNDPQSRFPWWDKLKATFFKLLS